MSPRPRPHAGLALRIYAVGVAQVVLVMFAVFLVNWLLRRAPSEHDLARARGFISTLGELMDSPRALERVMERLRDDKFVDVTLYRTDGTLVASTQRLLPPLAPPLVQSLIQERALIVDPGHPPEVAVVVAPEGAVRGYGLIKRREHGGRRPPNPIVGVAVALTLIAVISLWFARSLVRPLGKLAQAANRFGSGDLSARARIRRNDELGEVARTFDEMAERVNQLMRSQKEFLANVSHELRTPLARIRVALDIAAEGDVAAARRCLGEIAADWNDLDRLVADVLEAVRLDLARDPNLQTAALRYESVDVCALTERAVASFHVLHPSHTLAHDCAIANTTLTADGALLRRVIDNLLNNAAKYSDSGTTIRFTVERVDEAIEFVVADRGIGIETADLGHLFTPFFRTDRSRARATGGVGLGLVLAKRIVEAHGGQIRVESQVGVGTTVSFRIPLDHPDELS